MSTMSETFQSAPGRSCWKSSPDAVNSSPIQIKACLQRFIRQSEESAWNGHDSWIFAVERRDELDWVTAQVLLVVYETLWKECDVALRDVVDNGPPSVFFDKGRTQAPATDHVDEFRGSRVHVRQVNAARVQLEQGVRDALAGQRLEVGQRSRADLAALPVRVWTLTFEVEHKVPETELLPGRQRCLLVWCERHMR